MKVDRFDISKDKKENLFSSFNINRNATSDSEDHINNQQKQQQQPERIVISSPPNSPDTDSSQDLIFDTSTRRPNTLGPIRSRIALRRRMRFATSTPLRQRNHTANVSSSSDNDTATDLLMNHL